MKKANRLSILLYFCIAIAAAVAIGSAMASQIEDITISNENLSSFNTGWKLSVDGDVLGEIELPQQLQAQKNAIVRIQNTIPTGLKQNSTLFFRSSQNFVKIFVEDKLLASFGYESNQVFGRSPGSAWQVLRIPIEDFGKEITIQTISPYSRYSGDLSPVYIGTKAAIIFHIIGKNIFGVLIGLFILMTGLFLVLLNCFTRTAKINDAPLYLGIFSILMAVWLVGESKLLQLFFGNTFFLTNLVYLSLMLLPISFLLFLSTFETFRGDKVLSAFVGLFSANFIAANLLQITGLLDFFLMIPVTQAFIFAATIYLLVRLVLSFRQPKNLETGILALSIATLLLSGVLATVSFYLPNMPDSSAIVRIGFLIFISVLGIWASRQALLSLSTKIEQETLKTLAYTDTLTKLRNRAAFEAHMDLYRAGKNSRAMVLMFDLNNLKAINDSQSHSAGDRALLVAANLLQESFAHMGCCYRIGGDEFCVICDDAAAEAVEQAVASLNLHLERLTQNPGNSLSIAYGSALFTPEGGDIDATFRLADEEMYACKARMKRLTREGFETK